MKNFPEIDLSFAEILAVSGNKQHAKEFLDLTETPSKIAYYHESWLQKQSMYWEWLVGYKIFNIIELTLQLISLG